MSLLGIRVGQFIAWQLIVVTAVVAAGQRGWLLWTLGAVALAGFLLTVGRWRHRWAYDWLLTVLRHRRDRRPPPAVAPVRLRSGAEAGVVHDGTGFAIAIAVAPDPDCEATELPLPVLTSLLDPHDAIVSAVQVILHSELGAASGTSDLAGAYRDLGYCRVPRSESAWVVLRHDPVSCRSAVDPARGARDLQASLLRALGSRANRALDLLAAPERRCEILDARSLRELLNLDQVASARQPGDWRSWRDESRQHITYWLSRWPAGGIPALQQALRTGPACSVTTAVLITKSGTGRAGVTATVRVTGHLDADRTVITRAVRRAAASCGAGLARLDGEQRAGVLATLPLGQGPAGRWLSWRVPGTHQADPGTVLSVRVGGLVIGEPKGGRPGDGDGVEDLVSIPFFTGQAATSVTAVCDPLLPRLIAMRAIASGVRVQVVTAEPGGWLKLRQQTELTGLTVVRPGARPPAAGSQAEPWLVIDEVGTSQPAGHRPWQGLVRVVSATAGFIALPPAQDAILLQRTSAAAVATVAAALALSPAAERSLARMPDGVVAVLKPGGSARFAGLAPSPAEREILAQSW